MNLVNRYHYISEPKRPAFIYVSDINTTSLYWKNLGIGGVIMFKIFLDEQKAYFDSKISEELNQSVNHDREAIEQYGEQAKQKAIAERIAEKEAAIKSKYVATYEMLEAGYAKLATIEAVENSLQTINNQYTE